MVQQGTAARKLGARIVLMNASGRRGADYNFNEHKANIANALNEAAKAMADLGLQAVLHQHTGTMVEKRDEVYGIMDAIDTRVVKAGFDVGQLLKGGVDPVQIVKDFLPVIEHLHLKDYNGGEHYAGYCPLGQGKVDLAGDSGPDGEQGGPQRHGYGRTGSLNRHAGAGHGDRQDCQGFSAKAGLYAFRT